MSACIANPVDVRALATRPDVIGVEPGDVRHTGNQHAVAINVDVVRVGVGVAVGAGVGVGVGGVGVAVGVGVGVGAPAGDTRT